MRGMRVLALALLVVPGLMGQGAGAVSEPASVPATQGHPRLTVGKDTTVILGPLHADGTPNYLAAWVEELSRGVTHENNAVVLLAQALDLTRTEPKELHAPFHAALGFKDRPEGPLMTDWFMYARKLEAFAAANDPEHPDSNKMMERILALEEATTHEPWTAQEQPLVAKWLAENQEALDRVVEASKRPRYYLPALSTRTPPRLMDVLLPTPLGPIRAAVNALGQRALLHAGEGRPAEALADTAAMHRLARLVKQRPLVIDMMVAVGIDQRALAVEQAMLREGKLPAKEARALLMSLRDRAEIAEGMAEVIRGERLFVLDMVLAGPRGEFRALLAPWSGLVPEPKGMPMLDHDLAQADWNVVFRAINRDFDALEAVFAKPTAAQRGEAMRAMREAAERADVPANPYTFPHMGSEPDPTWEERAKQASAFLSRKEGESVEAYSRRMASFLNRLASTYHRVPALWDISRVQHRLTLLAAALAVYRAEHGAYPETLQALVTGNVLAKLPVDPFTDGAFVYRRAEGGYVLYSAGENGKDNGGKTRKEKGDDIAFTVP